MNNAKVDALVSFYENLSELARELRTAAGTVLTIVGSRLEADSRARVDEVGPQWLTEFEAERDHLEPKCGHCPACDPYDSSAAVSAAADPSPADNHHASRGAGDEGPEGASAIPPAAPSGQPTNAAAVCDVLDFRETHLPLRCTLDADHSGDHVAHGWGGQTWATWPQSMRADPESDPGVVTSPAPGEVLEDDLAAHIMGDFVSGQDVDPLTATLIDALSSRIASALLTDFTITRRA